MAEQVTVSKEFIDDLLTRIESLEEKLAAKEADQAAGQGDKKAKKLTDRLSSLADESSQETGKIIRGLVDASVEALNQTAEALASLSEETDREKLGKVPSAVVSVYRRSIDIQKKAVDKFEESYGQANKDE